MADKDPYVRLSREEIAKQFMLPERQSKIATLLKQDGQAYCICRSSDSSSFMIGCDNCEEWYHGDCIGITEKESKCIKQYFCEQCKAEDSTLVTKYKSRKRDGENYHIEEKETKVKKKREKFDSHEGRPTKRCGQCMSCYRTEDCGHCESCRDMKKYGISSRIRQKCQMRICVNASPRVRHVSKNSHQDSRFKRRRKDSSSDTNEKYGKLWSDKPRQCFGPTCTQAARIGSKYCSDECGLKLAANRIYQVLPQRIQEWVLSPCIAEEQNKKALENVRKQQMEVRRVLQELDKRHKELDFNIARVKNVTVDLRSEDDLEDESEMSMYCITCGHEIHSRTAIRHMEKCFNKYESQSSFGSIYKTRIEGQNMFCDYFNVVNRTYCKRLKVLCPEHSKDPKISDTEVCGCPLVTNVFEQTGEFCRIAKKKCMKHYCWEKLRRAEIDMERVRQWLKIDELIEQERQIRHHMASRAGVLALMLHSTYDHDIVDRINSAAQEMAMENQQWKMMDNLQGYHQQT